MTPRSAVLEEIDPRRAAAEPVAGLCGLCARAPGCTFPRAPGEPVRFCEEFEGLRRRTRVPEPHADPPRGPEARHPAGGLCATCEAFEGCTLPRSEAGVWRCEEFL